MALNLPRTSRLAKSHLRSEFSTTPRYRIKPRANPIQLLPDGCPPPPPYPYPPAYFYKQRNEGLYGGAMIQFGNNIGPESNVKTRRRWHPNIVYKHLYSRALDKNLRLKIRTRVLRTIDKVGGLDEYLLGGTAARIKELGEEGWRLRWAVLQTPMIQQRLESDARLRYAVMAMNSAYSTQPTEAVQAEVDLEIDEVEGAETEHESDRTTEELDIEERMRQRFEDDAYMREQPPPSSPSLWQRITGRQG